MLDAFIIEELRRREREQREQQRPVLELPIDEPKNGQKPRRKDDDADEPQRGVIVVDL